MGWWGTCSWSSPCSLRRSAGCEERLMDEAARKRIAAARKRWEETTLRQALARQPERAERFTTLSDLEVFRLYGPGDIAGLDAGRELGLAGEYPLTRGIDPKMCGGRVWTMRMFACF